MTSRLRALLSTSLAVTVLVWGAAAASRPAISDRGRAALSEFLRASVARGDAPAVVALVADPDRVLYLEAFGKRSVAGNADATPDTIFRIASMTKPVTSLAAVMLSEAGTIGLDDPATKYLPDFRQPPVLVRLNEADATFDSRPASRPIAIRDLLTNTSGIGYAFSSSALARLDAAGKSEAELPLLHDPGAKWTYGWSTALLGRVLERASGQKLDVLFKARIFDPLGMHDTAYAVPPDRRDRVVTAHARQNGALTERPNAAAMSSNVRGDGGLFSTAADYGAFLQLFLNLGRHKTTRLVSERAIRSMMSNQIGGLVVEQQPSANPTLARPFPIGAGKDKFGFGFQIETPPSEKGMRSPGSLSWGGINNTHFWIDPERRIAAVVLMQVLPYYDDRCLGVLRGFERTLYRVLE